MSKAEAYWTVQVPVPVQIEPINDKPRLLQYVIFDIGWWTKQFRLYFLYFNKNNHHPKIYKYLLNMIKLLELIFIFNPIKWYLLTSINTLFKLNSFNILLYIFAYICIFSFLISNFLILGGRGVLGLG